MSTAESVVVYEGPAKEADWAAVVGCVHGEAVDAADSWLRRGFGIESLSVHFELSLASLTDRGEPSARSAVRAHLDQSLRPHGASVVAVVAQAHCRHCPGSPDEQLTDLCEAVETLDAWASGAETIGLWIDETGTVDRLL